MQFLTYNGAYGETNRVLAFVQQFNAAFGGEDLDEGYKLFHVAMYLVKSGKKWWSNLKMTGKAPCTWKACRVAIMKQFLMDHAALDDVLAEWRSLHLDKGEPIKKYINRFWDLHFKACVFEEIGFQAQKHQYVADLLEDMHAYINAQNPRIILVVIHHSMLAYKIFYSSHKVVAKPNEKCEKISEKPFNGKKNQDAKKKEKGVYKGTNKLSLEEPDRKDNRCF